MQETEMKSPLIKSYTMKLRLYPSREQALAIDRAIHALHIAFNMTFHQVFMKNPAICTEPKENDVVWPDWKKMAKKEWRAFLIAENPAVGEAPAASLTTNNGLFLKDGEKAWEKTFGKKCPVIPDRRKEFHFYNTGKPRRSYLMQIDAKHFMPSPDNPKVAWIRIPKIGKIKARGFNHKLRFGENGQYTYTEALAAGIFPKSITVQVSKDPCGDYFVSITLANCFKLEKPVFPEEKIPIGVDAGVKEIAVLSDGQKIENKHFKKEKKRALKRLNRALSRRWGPANMAYRDYNKNIRQENKKAAEEMQQPLAQPSRRYQKSQHQKALIERKIARKRDAYYHQQTAALIRKSSEIAIESLQVKNMMRNHKLAFALADAAMSDFLGKLKYKAEWHGITIHAIGAFDPSSQLCSHCGYKNEQVKNLGVRFWVCPQCGAKHDRDINAARNILKIAQAGGVREKENADAPPEKPPGKPRARAKPTPLAGRPELAIIFSKELTRPNDPRYVIINTLTNTIHDDAQGAGYRSISNARNCLKAKAKWGKNHAAPEIP